ncbi:MAG TPA: class I SAM-dependent methyltransferase [Chthoniobacterales bacterium]
MIKSMATTEVLEDRKVRSALTSALCEVCPVCIIGRGNYLLAAPDRFHLRNETYQLVRCSTCTGVWLESPPSFAEMGLHYTEDYHRAIMAAGEGDVHNRWQYQQRVISRYKQGGAILDIGCSSGAFLSMMKAPSWDLYGIEMEESTAERARKTTGAKVFVGEATTAPFRADSFDVITSFDLLEHVYSPRQFLGKVLEWLKPGGVFYAMMPNIDSWEARVFGTHWYGLELPRHLFHFSPRSVRYLMEELGFEEVLIRTPRASYAERSFGYLFSSLLQKYGFSATPQAKPSPRTFLERLARKGMRVTILNPIAWIASLAGAGPSMEVAFRKPSENHSTR